MEWQPTKEDIAWQERMIDACSDGAVWGTTAAIYRVNKKEKKLEVIQFTGVHKETVHDRIVKVCKAIGWEVV